MPLCLCGYLRQSPQRHRGIFGDRPRISYHDYMRILAVLGAFLLMAASDLDQRLAKWEPVKMPFNASTLGARERQMVQKLVEASQYLDSIYWRQADPEG